MRNQSVVGRNIKGKGMCECIHESRAWGLKNDPSA